MRNSIKNLRGVLQSILLMCMACLLLHCAVKPWPVYEKEGEKFGVIEGNFRGKWWNYYERGLSYLSGGYFQDALTDFAESIKRNPVDMHNAQTYGTNFIDYFPHRELGILFYKTGNLKDAEEELELSLSQFFTAKASYYLDCVRKGLIDKYPVDIPPPVIKLDLKEEEVFTRDDLVVISGDAIDEHYISDLRVNGDPVFMQGSKKQVRFEQSLELTQGRQVIDIEARNLAGKAAKARIIFVVDREGPVISIDEFTITRGNNGQGVFIKGFIEDPAKVSRFYINGKKIDIEAQQLVEINRVIHPSKAKISLVAVDSLGNSSNLHIPLASSFGSHATIRFASADPCIISTDPGLASAGPNLVSAADLKAGLRISFPDSEPSVRIEFNDHIPDNITLYQDTVEIKGQAESHCPIRNIYINKEPARYKRSKLISFSKVVPLKKGENIIIVEAIDEEGNKGEAKRLIRGETPQALDWRERMILSVPLFKHSKNNKLLTGADDTTSYYVQIFLKNALSKKNRFRILDKDAQYYIEGTINETGESLEIWGEIKDTEHGELFAPPVNAFTEDKNRKAIEELGDKMACGILIEFPMIKGEVKLCKNKYIFTNVNHEKLKMGTNLIVYREEVLVFKDDEAIEEVAQELTTDHKVLDRARLVDMLSKKITKALLYQCKPGQVRVSDKVITE